MSNASITISFGNVKIEYQGEQSFIENGLIEIVQKTVSISNEQKPQGPASAGSGTSNTNLQQAEENLISLGAGAVEKSLNGITMNALCKKLGTKTDTDLVIASAYMIQLIEQQDTFSADEIKTVAKRATSYVGKHFSSNYRKSIQTLTKNDRFREPSENVFTLAPDEVVNLEAKLSSEG